jgi:hypothetical protein
MFRTFLDSQTTHGAPHLQNRFVASSYNKQHTLKAVPCVIAPWVFLLLQCRHQALWWILAATLDLVRNLYYKAYAGNFTRVST